MDFRGKIALVTGASSGIGHATSLALARAGACLALAARSTDALESLASEARRAGVDALPIPTDVSVPAEVAALGVTALRHFGRVDLLVCCAGQYVREPLTRPAVPYLEQALAVNFFGSVRAVEAVLPGMLARGSGHIVLVTSADGRRGLPTDGPYVASKAALCGYGDVLRQELHGTGVGLTVVAPGRVDTPMVASMRFPAISSAIPPEAVARAILRGISRRQAEVILPAPAWFLYFCSVLAPGFTDWAVRRLHLQGWDSDHPAD